MTSELSVSVIIEGYNESLDIGCLDQTLDSLRQQSFPLAEVQLILVGSEQQASQWRQLYAQPAPFARIDIIATAGDHYYALKNRGASQAEAPILAFLDSDVIPEPAWLETLVTAIRGGAPATCGPSLFRSDSNGPYSLPLLAAAAISWGFIYSPAGRHAFLSHNFAIRRDLFRSTSYRTDLGRTCAGSALHDTLLQAGVQPRFLPAQRVAHAFFFRWWTARLHVRFGHEVYLLHRMDSGAVSRHARWLGPLDAILTPVWHIVLDFPKWWRYSRVLGLPLSRRLAGLFPLLPLSLAARSAEAAGMLFTLFAPARARRFAAQN